LIFFPAPAHFTFGPPGLVMPTGLLAHCSPLPYRCLPEAEAAVATCQLRRRTQSRRLLPFSSHEWTNRTGVPWPSFLHITRRQSPRLLFHNWPPLDSAPPPPPHPYKRCPHLLLSSPRSPLSSFPHLRDSGTFSLSSLRRHLPSPMPSCLSPSAASCQPG
jgi:hypothetical protein